MNPNRALDKALLRLCRRADALKTGCAERHALDAWLLLPDCAPVIGTLEASSVLAILSSHAAVASDGRLVLYEPAVAALAKATLLAPSAAERAAAAAVAAAAVALAADPRATSTVPAIQVAAAAYSDAVQQADAVESGTPALADQQPPPTAADSVAVAPAAGAAAAAEMSASAVAAVPPADCLAPWARMVPQRQPVSSFPAGLDTYSHAARGRDIARSFDSMNAALALLRKEITRSSSGLTPKVTGPPSSAAALPSTRARLLLAPKVRCPATRAASCNCLTILQTKLQYMTVLCAPMRLSFNRRPLGGPFI